MSPTVDLMVENVVGDGLDEVSTAPLPTEGLPDVTASTNETIETVKEVSNRTAGMVSMILSVVPHGFKQRMLWRQ